jgi:hypothetical protein
VRIRSYFRKPKGVHEQERLGNTGIEEAEDHTQTSVTGFMHAC